MLWVEFHAEFVVDAAEVLDECVSGTDHAGREESFETTYWPQSGLESSIIGLDRIDRMWQCPALGALPNLEQWQRFRMHRVRLAHLLVLDR